MCQYTKTIEVCLHFQLETVVELSYYVWTFVEDFEENLRILNPKELNRQIKNINKFQLYWQVLKSRIN